MALLALQKKKNKLEGDICDFSIILMYPTMEIQL